MNLEKKRTLTIRIKVSSTKQMNERHKKIDGLISIKAIELY